MSVTPLNAAALGLCFFASLAFFVAAFLRVTVRFHRTQLSPGSLLILALLINWFAWTVTVLTLPKTNGFPTWLAAGVLILLAVAYLYSLNADRKSTAKPTDPPAAEEPTETRRAA